MKKRGRIYREMYKWKISLTKMEIQSYLTKEKTRSLETHHKKKNSQDPKSQVNTAKTNTQILDSQRAPKMLRILMKK